jgi:putative oxidoreductase
MTANLDARLNPQAPAVLSLFRVIFGLLLLCHATQKLFGLPVASPGGTAPVGSWPYWWAGIIELVCAILITLGLFTRIAAFVASGEMAFAYFTQHFPKGFWPIENGGELAVMNCFAFLLLVFTGGGLYALDSRIGPHRVARSTATPRRRWRR